MNIKIISLRKSGSFLQPDKKYDLIIIGAGIMGLTCAYEYLKIYPKAYILVVEKESTQAEHASGRNSGVLHAGFYYTQDSLKARYCIEGNQLMKRFCKGNQIPVLNCGKLVVAKNDNEIKILKELYQRGQSNKVPLELLNVEQTAQIDPNVKTHQLALWSPSTASVDPKTVCHKIKETLLNRSVQFLFNTKVHKIQFHQLSTNRGIFKFNRCLNTAGLHADKLAHQIGVGKNYQILPFKGLYLRYKGSNDSLKTHVYPVPHPGNAFLGVHFTKTVNGNIKIGPTATPALWRENYKGLKRFSLNEMLTIGRHQSRLLLTNAFGFRDLAFQEIKKYDHKVMISQALEMVRNMTEEFEEIPAGIRAQLLDLKTDNLVSDFVIEQKGSIVHLLNAVSPAFTCSFALAKYVVEKLH